MTTAAIRDDVDATIALWIWQEPTVTAAAAWQRLVNEPRRVSWNTVRTFMLGWLACAECLSLQRGG